MIEGFDVRLILAAVLAFAVCAIVMPVLIPYLKRLKFGQQILEDGPSWHEKKSGTPTMGGLGFILAAAAATAVMLAFGFDVKLLMMLLVSVGFGAIGFVDDYIKVVKKRNLGLTASQKFLLQAILAAVYVLVLKQTGELESEVILPFVRRSIMMPWWLYVPFILVVVTGTVNAVNLTDGLDGLAASVTVVVTAFFTLAAKALGESDCAYFAIAVAGGCLGFLIYNRYPARVFMGDTGSLFLGGAVSVLAVGMKLPLVLIIAGFVYLFETLSVILQVASFKLTGKRIFKMSPIHHHFELCGWSEKKIVSVFCLAALIFCALAYVSVLPYAAR